MRARIDLPGGMSQRIELRRFADPHATDRIVWHRVFSSDTSLLRSTVYLLHEKKTRVQMSASPQVSTRGEAGSNPLSSIVYQTETRVEPHSARLFVGVTIAHPWCFVPVLCSTSSCFCENEDIIYEIFMLNYTYDRKKITSEATKALHRSQKREDAGK